MSGDSEYAIECEKLGRVYTARNWLGQRQETVALRELTLQIPRGAVFGILGPNGAGKTTTVRVLSTLLSPSSGQARVLGFDVARQPWQIRRHIGLILGGDKGLYGRLTGRENLRYYGALNHMPPRQAKQRADQLLDLVGLTDNRDVLVGRYSRGMKQRLHIGRGLMMDPDVLFLDEPTIGLDPVGAQDVRQIVPKLAQQGKTVLLTTHYMFEADELSQTIAIINHGELVALGTPTEIKRNFSKIAVIEATVKQMRQGLTEQLAALEGAERVDTISDGAIYKFSIQERAGAKLQDQVVEIIGADNVEYILTRDPTLEEAYLNILR